MVRTSGKARVIVSLLFTKKNEITKNKNKSTIKMCCAIELLEVISKKKRNLLEE